MYRHAFVCLCMYVSTCFCMYTYKFTHAHMYTRTFVYVYDSTIPCIYIHISIRMKNNAFVPWMYAWMYTCMYACSVYVCRSVYLYVCMPVPCMYAWMYTCTRTLHAKLSLHFFVNYTLYIHTRIHVWIHAWCIHASAYVTFKIMCRSV